MVTEPFSKISWIVFATSGATERTVRLSQPSVLCGRVSVVMISRAPHSLRRSRAGPENTPWVVAMMTSPAPAFFSTWTAPAMVPPVSIMSSSSTQVRPSTSPTTRLEVTLLATSMSRVLWMKASGAPPSWLAHFSDSFTRPASGETTTMLSRL